MQDLLQDPQGRRAPAAVPERPPHLQGVHEEHEELRRVPRTAHTQNQGSDVLNQAFFTLANYMGLLPLHLHATSLTKLK